MTNPLVDADWLFEHRNDARLIILDARSPKSKVIEKIPNSIHFDLEETFSDVASGLPHTMISPEKFQHEARKLGIDQNSTIVVYDDIGSYWSPRVWWMFRSMGFENIEVLNGGLIAWKDAGFETVENFISPTETGNFTSKYKSEFFCSASELFEKISEKSSVVIDARNTDRYNGLVDEPRQGLKRGHIPTAINIPFEDCLAGNRLKPKPDLEKLFDDLNKQTQLIFSCGSGVTACIVALAATVAGFDDLRVYDGSWSEWGSGDFPVA
ncbi:MAG: sulfurtransferase [Flavobacterium sp.]|uniref:sulfurtransferase n=1 Tax=Flavobacterium sp. TaxID=239 RepID=UPI00121736E6|nr:sulfurtransferase [Flavobacterium sp.]RZJ68304.1 MAG: sulfurtransferase [Flavobacterium sp.]